MSPRGLTDISGEQWLFGAFSATDSSYGAIQEMVNVRRGSESGNNQLNSFLQGGVLEGTGRGGGSFSGTTLLLTVETSYLMLRHKHVVKLSSAILQPIKDVNSTSSFLKVFTQVVSW